MLSGRNTQREKEKEWLSVCVRESEIVGSSVKQR